MNHRTTDPVKATAAVLATVGTVIVLTFAAVGLMSYGTGTGVLADRSHATHRR